MRLEAVAQGFCYACQDQQDLLYPFNYPTGEKQLVCAWCAERCRQFLQTSNGDEAINIFWGAGKVTFPEMKWLGRFIFENGIKSVIEYGTGLSTECLAFFVDDLWTFDELPRHLKFYSRLKPINFVKYHLYDSTTTPRIELPKLDRKFDMAFIDGGQERSCEVRHAMEHATKYIYLADPNMGEQGFFPTDEWELIWGEKRLWKRK